MAASGSQQGEPMITSAKRLPVSAILAALILVGTMQFDAADAQPFEDDDVWISGVIKSFECGDNCWLTIARTEGEETGLCFAKPCLSWWHENKMPSEFLEKQVQVKLGVGWKRDGEYQKNGYAIAFEEIRFR